MHAAEGQAELFVERRLGDVAAAVSASGESYADLENAFRFREDYVPACHAQLKAGLAALDARYREAVASLPPRERSTTYPLPRLRPLDIGEDPETASNRRGGLNPRSLDRIAVAHSRPVRHVGEEYYADIYDPDAPPPEAPQYRPPLGFDLLGTARNIDVSGLSEPADTAAY